MDHYEPESTKRESVRSVKKVSSYYNYAHGSAMGCAAFGLRVDDKVPIFEGEKLTPVLFILLVFVVTC